MFAEAGGSVEEIGGNDERREDYRVETCRVHGEGLAEPTTGMAGRDDDEVVGEVEQSGAVPVAGEKGDCCGQDGCLPASEVAGRRNRRVGERVDDG